VLGTAASVMGNEAAIRMGRRNLIGVAMLGSMLIAGTIGYLGSLSYAVAVVMMILYGFVVWLDSSSLTAGAAGTADPARRGAQLAVHSSLGYAGGFVGPLIIGFILDMGGGMSPTSWSMAFLSVAVLTAIALAIFVVIRPQELAGDRSTG
jgi:MFS family permease